MSNSHRAFGIDLSRYNTHSDGKTLVDINTIARHDPEVVFIAMRAGISWGYQDPWFSYYFQEAQRIGRVRMAYHVLYPGESPTAQMDNFFRILGTADYDKTPLVLDLELDHGQSKARITRCAADAVTRLTQRTGRIPFIYSRASWINLFLDVSSLPPVHWWFANYLWPLPYPLYTAEHPGPPALPVGVRTWTIHQTASRGKSIGSPAYYMDYNRWNGTKQDVLAFVGEPVKEPIECPVDHLPCPRIFA